MEVAQFLTPKRCLLLRSGSKHAALKSLVTAVCREYTDLDAGQVLASIDAREREISTLIAPGIALPHARLAQLSEPVVAVGLHRAGLPWQAVSAEPVHLVILVLGRAQDPGQHLQLLSGIARMLGIESRRMKLLSAQTARDLHDAFSGTEPAAMRESVTRRDRVTRTLLSHAAGLAKDAADACVMVHDDGALNPEWLDVFPEELPVILCSRDTEKYAGTLSPSRILLQVPSKGLAPKYRVELAMLLAITQGLVGQRGTVVNVYGDTGPAGLDNLSVVDIAQAYGKMPCLYKGISGEDIDYQVLNRVLNIALSLANEGREGRPVGTIFVVGDYARVTQRSSQIVINPFRGYPENERSIIDPSLEETVKEFAGIDGAFLLRGDGVIMAAGACLQTGPESSRLPSGLGTRHFAAMSITAHTAALSVVISQSTGSVRIFKEGKEVLVLEKSGRHS